jgi:RNA polymerase sigma-70 factor (ECF subfamily)
MPETAILDPEVWVDEHGDYLFRYAMLRVRDREAAEEIVQETFLAALRSRGSFSGRSSERTWLVGILKHKVIDYFRRAARERPASELAAGPDSEDALFDEKGKWRSVPRTWDTRPDTTFETKEFWEQFRNCLSGLRSREADGFVLRELEQMETGEICKILDVTPTNLAVILHRARKKLRECLDRTWFGQEREGGK